MRESHKDKKDSHSSTVFKPDVPAILNVTFARGLFLVDYVLILDDGCTLLLTYRPTVHANKFFLQIYNIIDTLAFAFGSI